MLIALTLAAAPPLCALETATAATARTLGRDPERWLGRCVVVEGFARGAVFFDDAGGRYRSRASDARDRSNEGWLGFYPKAPVDYRKVLTRVRITGVVHDCGEDFAAAEAEAGPDEIVWMTGYCHSSSGLALRGAVPEYGEQVQLARLTGDRARLRFGDLHTLDEVGPPPAAVQRLVRRFVGAVRRSDSKTLESLVDGWNESVPETPEGRRRWGEFLVGERGVFSSLAQAFRPEPAYFRARSDRDDAKYGYRPDWVACFCIAKTCEGEWPIARADALGDAEGPFACVMISADATRRGPWSLSVATRRRLFELD